MSKYVLIGSKGCGSVIVELALRKAGADFDLDEIPYLEPGPDRNRLLELNPLGLVPTLVMPDGDIMTESAAMILHLADAFPDAQLVPSSSHQQRPHFLRWLFYLVSEIYPTFTFGDNPGRWQLPQASFAAFRASLDGYRNDLWSQVEDVADTPYFLGDEFSAIDLYVAVMRNWRPGPDKFTRRYPKLSEIADNIARDDLFAEVLHQNFSSR